MTKEKSFLSEGSSAEESSKIVGSIPAGPTILNTHTNET